MLLVWPVVIPLLTAIAAQLAWRSPRVQQALSLTGAVLLLAAGVALAATVLAEGPQAMQMGGWPSPFGITMVADILSAAMVLVAGIVTLAVVVYGIADIAPGEARHGQHALTHALLVGVCGAFLTGDIFNLYVWFEVMLISSFGLLVVGGRAAQMDGALKYVGLNLVATLCFLTGVGLLYGATGALNMADLHRVLEGRQGETAVLGAAALLLFAFGVKAAMFPVFFWLPASYPTLSVTSSALFSGLLTKVGVYALVRVFTLVFDGTDPAIQAVLLWGAAITMVVGVLGAAAQTEIRRILSFHIVSQIGYMILGLAFQTMLGLAGAVFYIVHHIIVKANLFLIAGIIGRQAGSEDLSRIGGLWRHRPWLGVLFLVPALSLAGMPPLSGFWAKLLILRASIEDGRPLMAFIVLLVGILTLYSMSKIWMEAFWKPHPEGDAALPLPRIPLAALLPALALAGLTLLIGLHPQPFLVAADEAAGQILDPAAYLAAVDALGLREEGQ